MGTTLESLEIEFRAETGPLREELAALNAQLMLTGAAALTANAGLATLAGSGLAAAAAGALALLPRLQQAGVQGGQALARGLASGVVGARSAGHNAGLGFAQGLRAATGSVLAAANALAAQATARLRSALQIHSPSLVMRGLGADAGEGFALGLGDALRAVERQADALAQTARGGEGPAGDLGASAGLGTQVRSLAGTGAEALSAEALQRVVQTAVGAAMERLQITVPLNVDGVKLGEASIRGINAVTRRTGRLQLEI